MHDILVLTLMFFGLGLGIAIVNRIWPPKIPDIFGPHSEVPRSGKNNSWIVTLGVIVTAVVLVAIPVIATIIENRRR